MLNDVGQSVGLPAPELLGSDYSGWKTPVVAAFVVNPLANGQGRGILTPTYLARWPPQAGNGCPWATESGPAATMAPLSGWPLIYGILILCK
jgi:hypothetical protein